MAETFETLEQATQALTSTAQRAATLMRQESDRARLEAGRAREEADKAWGQIETIRGDILTAKQEIDSVRSAIFSAGAETQRARNSARCAWSAVGVMAVLVMIAVGWTASVLTRSSTQLSHLSDRIGELTALANNSQSELASLRGSLESSRLAQARAEAELHAASYSRPLAPELSRPVLDLQYNTAGPTTRPSISEMISNLLLTDLPKLGQSFMTTESNNIVEETTTTEIAAPAKEESAKTETPDKTSEPVTATTSLDGLQVPDQE